MRFGAKRDENERYIVQALRQLGAIVVPLDERDIPDLLVGHRGVWRLIEVKRPKTGVLSPGQASFLATCKLAGLPVHVVRSVEEAVGVLE